MFRQLALALTLPGRYATHIVVSPDYCPPHMFTHRFELVLRVFFSPLCSCQTWFVKVSYWMFCTWLCGFFLMNTEAKVIAFQSRYFCRFELLSCAVRRKSEPKDKAVALQKCHAFWISGQRTCLKLVICLASAHLFAGARVIFLIPVADRFLSLFSVTVLLTNEWRGPSHPLDNVGFFFL